MPRYRAAVIAALAVVLSCSSVAAEPKAPPKGKAPPGLQIRYFDLSSNLFSELGSESILKETRQGNTVVSAELDVCHLVSPSSNRLDRFVVPLKVENNRLTGTGQTQETKQAVSVNLTRRAAGGDVTFQGTVASGSQTDRIQATLNEMSEDEINEQYLVDSLIQGSPTDFSVVWPQALFARVERGALGGLLEALRDQNVRVHLATTQASCRMLRSGRYTVQIDVEAERAAGLLAKLKTVAGVSEAGYSPNPPNMQRAIRFPSAGFRDAAGKLDRDKIAAALASAFAKAMSASPGSTSFDPIMGELSIELKRPDSSVADLKLTQVITITAVFAPESPTANTSSILWIESIGGRIIDERPEPRLTFAQVDGSGDGQTEPDGTELLVDAAAAALKGVTWDSEQEQWRQ